MPKEQKVEKNVPDFTKQLFLQETKIFFLKASNLFFFSKSSFLFVIRHRINIDK